MKSKICPACRCSFTGRKKWCSLRCRIYDSTILNKNTGCMEWKGVKPGEYGKLYLDGRIRAYAHRVTWELNFGPIPRGLFICHHCDNSRCINIDHLFVGTQKENMIDAANKGRTNPVRPMLGKNHSEATKARMRIARLARESRITQLILVGAP